MALVPYPPIIERPLQDKFGAGMSWLPRWPVYGTFEHTMLGTLWGTDAYFRLWNVNAATDYGIGGIRDGDYDGRIFRWINYFERRNTAGWANGWNTAPDLTTLGAAYLKTYGNIAINGGARSIEGSGLLNDPITAKQWTSTIHLTAAIHHTEIGQGYEEYAWNLEHADVAEKDCAFPRYRRFVDEFKTSVKDVMFRFETGRDIPDFRMFGDTKVWLPGGADITVPEPPADKPVMIAFPAVVTFTTRAGALSRQWAYSGANVVRRYPAGTTLRCVGYYHGEEVSGDDRWLVIRSPGVSNNARIHVSGVKEPIPDPGLGR